jgi:hypothetical protein
MILPSRRAKCRLKSAEQLLLHFQNVRGFTDVCFDNFQLNEFDLTDRGLTSILKSPQLINVHHQHIHGVPRENNKTYLNSQHSSLFIFSVSRPLVFSKFYRASSKLCQTPPFMHKAIAMYQHN